MLLVGEYPKEIHLLIHCVILTGEYSNIKSNSFILSQSQITNNKLYVAFTRAKNIVYVISKDKFDLYKGKYLK